MPILKGMILVFFDAGNNGSGITVKGKSSMLDEIIATGGNNANITKGE